MRMGESSQVSFTLPLGSHVLSSRLTMPCSFRLVVAFIPAGVAKTNLVVMAAAARDLVHMLKA